jgi:bifunctional NMN adenylyltransferase/nudix hydrolase
MAKDQDHVCVLIGRFQPFHNGHALLLHRALESAPRVVVVLGSSFHARSPKDPFTWQERAAMIEATLSETDRERVAYIPVRDYYDDRRWANSVRRAVTNEINETTRITLVGYFKDSSSYYLNLFPQWELQTVESPPDIDATNIRQVIFEAEDMEVSLSALAGWLATPVRQYLKAWAILGHYRNLVEEHRRISSYRAAWKTAPYAPIFVTVDAVIKTSGHVLLVQRNGFPGKGLWALPGGFLDQHERLLDACVRELQEETSLGVLPSTLTNALTGVKVFDHPRRSLRGRTITHAHYFDLGTEQLPEVQAADDAAAAKWTPISDLASMEDQFHEDHFHILDEFLHLTDSRN